MAKVRARAEGRYVEVNEAGVVSGDIVTIGQIPGVAMTDADANDDFVMDTQGVYSLSVTGADDMGNAAIAAGDILYDDAGTLNVDSVNGIRFGYALEAVNSGATATILVKVGY